jgi:hypothetical protein
MDIRTYLAILAIIGVFSLIFFTACIGGDDDNDESGLTAEDVDEIVEERLAELGDDSDEALKELRGEILEEVDSRIGQAQGETLEALRLLREEIEDSSSVTKLVELLVEVRSMQTVTSTSQTTTTSSNGGTTTSTSSGSSTTSGLVTQTACGPMEWGPAGPAPGHDTNDSGEQVREAISVMQVPEGSQPYVTVHKACPGEDVPNGWIVGSSYTESEGIVVGAKHLPAGTCIDYDHNVTTISGEVYHTQKFHDRSSRTQIMSDGSAVGLKFTGYWTPCVFTDGTPSWEGNGTNNSDTGSTTSASCPATASEAAAMYGGASSNWAQHPQYGNGWIYAGPVISGFAVPTGGKVDYDGGSQETGNVPSGSAFTAWCPK